MVELLRGASADAAEIATANLMAAVHGLVPTAKADHGPPWASPPGMPSAACADDLPTLAEPCAIAAFVAM